MATIKELKEELQFDTELIELLDTMKNMAAFQFHALQAKKEQYEKFFTAVSGFFQLIGGKGSAHPMMTPRTAKEAVIMVTSEEGFMGSLNSQVVNAASAGEKFTESELIVIGERGSRYLKEMGRRFVPFKGVSDDAGRRGLALELGNYIINGVREGRFGKVSIAYPKPVSFMVQRIEIIKIMPFFDPEQVAEAKPGQPQELIIESPLDGIIDYLAEEVIRQRLIDILEESKLSEFAARAIHLENSSQELVEKKKKVTLQYFKAYHEMIDKSTRELFAAQILIRG